MKKDEIYILNSLLFIFFLYLLNNTLSFIIALYEKNLGGDFISSSFQIDNFNLLLKYYLLSVIIILFFIIFSKNLLNLKFHIKSFYSSSKDCNLIHLIFLFFNFIFLSSVIIGIGGIKSNNNNNNIFLIYIYQLFQFPYLIAIYIYNNKNTNNLLYKINFLIYFISVMSTGFLGYLFFLFPFFLKKIKLSNIKNIFLFICIFLSLPFLYIFKYLIKNPPQSLIELSNLFTMKNLLIFFRIVIDRFTYFHNSYEIQKNIFFFQNKFFNTHQFDPWFQGYFGSLFHKILFSTSVGNINGIFYNYFFNNGHSNMTFPFISYFDIDFFYGVLVFFYSIIIIGVSYFLISLIDKTNLYLKYSLIICAYVLLINGWFWPFINYMQSLLIYIIIFIFLNFFKRKKLLCYHQ